MTALCMSGLGKIMFGWQFVPWSRRPKWRGWLDGEGGYIELATCIELATHMNLEWTVESCTNLLDFSSIIHIKIRLTNSFFLYFSCHAYMCTIWVDKFANKDISNVKTCCHRADCYFVYANLNLAPLLKILLHGVLWRGLVSKKRFRSPQPWCSLPPEM